MKPSLLRLTLLVFLAATCSALGQLNIVGYINRTVYPGDNLIANQLNATPNNSINNILLGVADGATLTKWDSAANAFLPQSVFNLGSQTWSINYSLNLGEGALLSSPLRTTNTFVGEVGPYLNLNPPPRQINWNPNYPNGLHLISCPTPFGDATFDEVVGRAPLNGDWVKRLNEQSQTYSMTTFNGLSWDNGIPTLTVGQAAWFGLGVPEPSAITLSGMAALLILLRQRRQR